MNVEYDEAKNQRNIDKHHLSFDEAAESFSDEFFLEIPAKRRGEKRRMGLGELNGSIIATIYTMREDNIRIISARLATERERKSYYDKRKQ